MWVCLKNSFLSIVDKECKPGELLVRARRPGDIEAVFPAAVVKKSTSTDYAYRAVIKRADVAEANGAAVFKIDYPNFKNAVRDDALHNAYSAFWGIHARLQPTAPYTGRAQRGML